MVFVGCEQQILSKFKQMLIKNRLHSSRNHEKVKAQHFEERLLATATTPLPFRLPRESPHADLHRALQSKCLPSRRRSIPVEQPLPAQ